MKTQLILAALLVALGGAAQAQDINIAEQEKQDSTMMFDFEQDFNIKEMMEKFAPMMGEMSQMLEGLTGDFETMLESPELNDSFNDVQQSLQRLMDAILKEADIEELKEKAEDMGNRLMQ